MLHYRQVWDAHGLIVSQGAAGGGGECTNSMAPAAPYTCVSEFRIPRLPSQSLLLKVRHMHYADVDVDAEGVLAQAMCIFASFSGR